MAEARVNDALKKTSRFHPVKQLRRDPPEENFVQRNKFLQEDWLLQKDVLHSQLKTMLQEKQRRAQDSRVSQEICSYKQNICLANKWDIIRTRREEMLELLNFWKEKRRWKATACGHIMVRQALVTLATLYRQHKRKRKFAMQSTYVAMIFVIRMRKRIRRLG